MRSQRNLIDAPVQGEEAADDLSPGSPISPTTPTAKLTDANVVLDVSVADGGRLQAANANGIAIARETATIGEAGESPSVKKPVTAHEGAATPKTTRKAVGTVANRPAVETKSVATTAMDRAIPVTGQTGGTVVAPPNEIGKASEEPGEAVSGAKLSVGVPSMVASEPPQKETAHGAKIEAMDAGATVPAVSDAVAQPKPDTVPEKSTEVGLKTSSSGDSTTDSASGPAAAMVHTMPRGNGLPSGMAPGVVVPGVVVSGSSPGDSTATKLPLAELSTHTTGLQSNSREFQGSDVAATAMNEMPRMLTATPTSLEVGFQSGTHGWLKVRAEMVDGGVVNASVSAASSTGQEMLHRELPALTAYLQEEKVAVNTLVIHSTAGAEPRGSGAGINSGGGGQTPQKSNEGGQQQDHAEALSDGTDRPINYRGLNVVGRGGTVNPLAAYAIGGSWLSVRA